MTTHEEDANKEYRNTLEREIQELDSLLCKKLLTRRVRTYLESRYNNFQQEYKELTGKYLLTKTKVLDKKTEEKIYKEETKKVNALQMFSSWIGLIVSTAAVLLFILFITTTIIKTFPDYVPIPNANNILEIWITTNGVLIGFAGIIFAQLISSTMNQQNTLYEKILVEETHNIHRINNLEKRLKSLEIRKIFLSLLTTSTLALFAYSILFSMQGIASNSLLKITDTYAINSLMFTPLLASVCGISMLIIALVLPSKPSVGKTVINQQ
jgi:hypothetical protein